MRQTLRVIYFNLSLLCLLLVGMEVTGQVAFLIWKGYPVFQADRHAPQPHNQVFERHPYLVARLTGGVQVRQGDKVITTTAIHTRWTGADTGNSKAIRVAVVGGSTTFGSGVTDADSWPARLQALLGPGYAVTNYGVPGYSTAEGIIQMALVVPESRPDIVVFYEGWNDIRNYHEPNLGADYYSHGMRQYPNLQIEPPAPGLKPLLAKLTDVSATARFISVASKRLFGQPKTVVARDDQSDNPYSMTSGRESLFTTPDPEVDRLYLRNLTTLKLLARQLGAYIVLIPQVLDSSRFSRGTGSHVWTRHIQDDAMPGLMKRFNQTMNRVCGPHEANCDVIDEMASQQWESDDFLDEGHFLRKGNEKFARIVASQVLAWTRQHSGGSSPRRGRSGNE